MFETFVDIVVDLQFSFGLAAAPWSRYLCPLLGAWMMSKGPWIAIWVGHAMLFITILVSLTIPETLRTSTKRITEHDRTSSQEESNAAKLPTIGTGLVNMLRKGYAFLMQNQRTLLLMLCARFHVSQITSCFNRHPNATPGL